MNKYAVTIFASLVKESHHLYTKAREIARLFGDNGIDTISGGYDGLMSAVSEGARQGNARATGILVEFWDRKKCGNEWLTDRIVTPGLFERLQELIDRADGYIILPGGTGTLVELALVWELINKSMIEQKPICVYGDFWKPLLDHMESVPTEICKPVYKIPVIDTPEEVAGFFKREFYENNK